MVRSLVAGLLSGHPGKGQSWKRGRAALEGNQFVAAGSAFVPRRSQAPNSSAGSAGVCISATSPVEPRSVQR
jgi:hypothetical protein